MASITLKRDQICYPFVLEEFKGAEAGLGGGSIEAMILSATGTSGTGSVIESNSVPLQISTADIDHVAYLLT